MEWLNQLQGQTVGLDTAPLISFIQQDPKHIDKLRAFFTAMAKGDFEVVTSAITLSEVLVHPYKLGQIKLAQEYRDILLNQNHLTTFAVSSAIAEQTAQLRATYGKKLKTPDAIQIATALQAGATAFLTNDHDLSVVQNLKILVLDNII
jgi:predicted nucleic acid-binding protein